MQAAEVRTHQHNLFERCYHTKSRICYSVGAVPASVGCPSCAVVTLFVSWFGGLCFVSASLLYNRQPSSLSHSSSSQPNNTRSHHQFITPPGRRRHKTKPTRSTQPRIPLGSLNRVLALIGWGKGGNVTSAGWQI